MKDDLLWLLRNTRPVPGERGAAVESWWNVLLALGLSREEARKAIAHL